MVELSDENVASVGSSRKPTLAGDTSLPDPAAGSLLLSPAVLGPQSLDGFG